MSTGKKIFIAFTTAVVGAAITAFAKFPEKASEIVKKIGEKIGIITVTPGPTTSPTTSPSPTISPSPTDDPNPILNPEFEAMQMCINKLETLLKSSSNNQYSNVKFQGLNKLNGRAYFTADSFGYPSFVQATLDSDKTNVNTWEDLFKNADGLTMTMISSTNNLKTKIDETLYNEFICSILNDNNFKSFAEVNYTDNVQDWKDKVNVSNAAIVGKIIRINFSGLNEEDMTFVAVLTDTSEYTIEQLEDPLTLVSIFNSQPKTYRSLIKTSFATLETPEQYLDQDLKVQKVQIDEVKNKNVELNLSTRTYIEGYKKKGSNIKHTNSNLKNYGYKKNNSKGFNKGF